MKTDVVIVGGGLAGLYTALEIKDKQIVILTKDTIESTNSYLAQGGIAAELITNKEEILSHVLDTLTAGAWVNDPKSTETLVKEASKNIEHLIEYGVEFDREDGDLNLTLEGGHTKKRILHAGGDATGKMIMIALKHAIEQTKNITVISNTVAKDLLLDGSSCIGVSYFDKEGSVKEIYAENTVLATGGIGAVYSHTTNPEFATGDGVAMVYRAGGTIKDLEFIQFHPTALYLENQSNQNFLLTEALRGEGAHLVNIKGDRFMHKYDKRLELAPRDIVSASIVKEMYDTWHDSVFLDTRHMDASFLIKRFPTVYNFTKEHGYTLGTDLVPVIPVQHYSIGGIQTNIDGETSIKSLYASGECASTGVHGANRLASNSLLECIVFGNRIAEQINNHDGKEIHEQTHQYSDGNNAISYNSIIKDVRQIMDKYAGVVRTTSGLHTATELLDKHYFNLVKNPNMTVNYYKALNMVTAAKLVVKAAIARPVSIGCHNIVEDDNE